MKMSKWLVDKFIMRLLKNKIVLADAKVLVLGFAFKENCPDTRNTKSLDVITRLKDFGLIQLSLTHMLTANQSMIYMMSMFFNKYQKIKTLLLH